MHEFEHENTTWTFGSLYATEPMGREKGVNLLTIVTDSDWQGGTGLLLHNGGQEAVQKPGDSLGHLLVLPCPTIKVNRKLQQTKPGRKRKTRTLQEARCGSFHQVKNPDWLIPRLSAGQIQNG